MSEKTITIELTAFQAGFICGLTRDRPWDPNAQAIMKVIDDAFVEVSYHD